MRSITVLAAASAVLATVPNTPLCMHDGVCIQVPTVGQGSCCGSYNISTWLAAGGKHIDTSCDYGSQPTIAAAIAASGIPRSQLHITSKLNVESCGLNMTQALYQLVLDPLQMTYVDLLLLHHAGRFENDKNPHPPCFDASLAGGQGSYYNCRMQTISAFEDLRKQGLIKTWGVSNWNVRDLKQAKAMYGYYPAINQIELHPYWSTKEIVSFCNKNGILVEAYAPYGDGTRTNMLSDPILAPIAAKNNLTVGQLVLSWDLQTGGDIVIPRSHSAEHQAENLALWDAGGVNVNEWDIANISSIKTGWSKAYNTDCQPWC